MADGEWKGASWKQEEDYSKETDEILSKINSDLLPVLLRSSNAGVEDIVGELLVLEKKARLGGDTLSTSRLAVEVLKMFRVQGLVKEMLVKLDYLMKRRGQMKQVQTAMINECARALEDVAADTITSDAEKCSRRNELLTQLVLLTEGKIHVELEHARFAVQLSKIVESEGRRREAVDMLSELHVETITNMPRIEKLTVVLDELRLTLELDDLEKVPLVSRKFTYRALGKKDSLELKLQYFTLMADFFSRKRQYLMMARCAHEIYLTHIGADISKPVEEVQKITSALTAVKRHHHHAEEEDDEDATAATTTASSTKAIELTPEQKARALEALSNCAVLVMISEHLSEKAADDQGECAAFSPHSMQKNRLNWLAQLEKNQTLQDGAPDVHNLVKSFNSLDLVRHEVLPQAEEIAASHLVLRSNPERASELNHRLSEHDILVIAKVFTRIKIAKLASLVSLTESQCEEFIMSMVNIKVLFAKIDRLDGVISFEAKKSASEEVEEWNSTISHMMGLVDKISHFIIKERMLHAVTTARQQQQATTNTTTAAIAVDAE